MKVKITKLQNDAIIPVYSSASAAGADLYNASGTVVINPSQTVFIGTGIAMEIPEGYVGLVYARSGLACKEGLAPANKVGVIDSDYRGEIKVALHNHSLKERVVEKGERIAQIVITPYLKCEFEEGELSLSSRGEGGFGSTGKL
ncbi:MAG: dUTP diphosphatase [Clostridia bacterium]|nr:dUTP diphosphatase [Clostridia bacterium]